MEFFQAGSRNLIVENGEVLLQENGEACNIHFTERSWLSKNHVEIMIDIVDKCLGATGVKPFWYAVLAGNHADTKNMNVPLSSGTMSSLNLEVVLERLELVKETLQTAGIR